MGGYRIEISTALFATLFFCVLLEGCSPVTKMGGGVFYEEQKSIEYSHEWIDLHVKNYKFKGRSLCYSYHPSRLICHNTGDSTCSVAFITPNYRLLVNKDSVIYINDDYHEIAVYLSDDIVRTVVDTFSYYGLLVGSRLQQVSMLGLYSPLIDYLYPIRIDTGDVVHSHNDLVVMGYKDAKYCTANQCYIMEDTCGFVFNTRTGKFKYVEEISSDNRYMRRRQSIKSVRYDCREQLIDSLFNIYSIYYSDYSKQIHDSMYLMSVPQGYVSDTISKQVEAYPIVNIATGDTSDLVKIGGWRLLLLWTSRADYRQCVRLVRSVPDSIQCVLLNATTDNKDYLMRELSGIRILSETYFAKGMTRYLDIDAGYYLISPEGVVLFRSNNEWGKKTLLNNCSILNFESKKVKIISE